MKPTQKMIIALDAAVFALQNAGWEVVRIDSSLTGISYLNLSATDQMVAKSEKKGCFSTTDAEDEKIQAS